MSKNIIRLITLLFVLFIGYVIYSANTGNGLPVFKLIGKIPYGDKLGHMGLIGTLTFLINATLNNKVFKVSGRKILLGSALVFIFITIEEFSQQYTQ